MLDRTISLEQYNAMPDEVKAHYVKRGSNYVLDVNGVDPELTATQTQLDQARQKNITLESQVRTLTQEAKATEEKVRKEVETEINTLKTQNESLTKNQIDAERNKHIDAIASQFKLDNLIRSDLQSRIEVEVVDGEVKTTFKNKDGKPVDFKTLNEEYCKNPDYSAILKDGKSTPTFTPPKQGNDNGGSGGNQNQNGGALDYSKATPAEIAAHLANTVN